MAYINKNAKNTVAIRADIDALPIVETNNKSYKSIHSGKCMLVVMMVMLQDF